LNVASIVSGFALSSFIYSTTIFHEPFTRVPVTGSFALEAIKENLVTCCIVRKCIDDTLEHTVSTQVAFKSLVIPSSYVITKLKTTPFTELFLVILNMIISKDSCSPGTLYRSGEHPMVGD
jgi:hypothetical protein